MGAAFAHDPSAYGGLFRSRDFGGTWLNADVGLFLGGAVSIRLATERPCAGVAVVATFTSLREVARVHYGPAGAAIGSRFDSLGRIPKLGVPLFVAHGDEDEIVPYALGQRLYEAAPGPKRFLRVGGASHNDVLGEPALLDAIAAFAEQAVARGGRRDDPGE